MKSNLIIERKYVKRHVGGNNRITLCINLELKKHHQSTSILVTKPLRDPKQQLIVNTVVL